MADREDKNVENVPGKFYVDSQCIDCDLCRETAPNNFTRADDEGYSYVFKQPENAEELARRCERARPVQDVDLGREQVDQMRQGEPHGTDLFPPRGHAVDDAPCDDEVRSRVVVAQDEPLVRVREQREQTCGDGAKRQERLERDRSQAMAAGPSPRPCTWIGRGARRLGAASKGAGSTHVAPLRIS